MRSKTKKLISKYILLITFSFLVENVVSRYWKDLNITEEFITNEVILNSINLGLTLFINFIFVLVINHDRKEAGIVTKHVTLATIVYRPLGVFAFLLYVLYSAKEEVEVIRPIDLISDEDI